MKSWPARLAAVAALAVGATALPAAEPARLLEGFGRAEAVLETPVACYLLDVYLAETPAQRGQGLMFIRELADYEGMLFPEREPSVARMWMKNTYLSLDMLFIRTDGTVAGIAAATTPLSEAIIESPEPVSAVLELGAGFASRHGVGPGARFWLLDPDRAGIRPAGGAPVRP